MASKENQGALIHLAKTTIALNSKPSVDTLQKAIDDLEIYKKALDKEIYNHLFSKNKEHMSVIQIMERDEYRENLLDEAIRELKNGK